MITVEKLLEMPVLSGLKVVAGRQGLDREVKVVSVMDAPGSYKWLKGGELLLTTGYLYGADSGILHYQLNNLIEAGASGLGKKRALSGQATRKHNISCGETAVSNNRNTLSLCLV